MMRLGVYAVMALATTLTVSTALAQQPAQTERVGGTVERVDGNTIYGKKPDGGAITIKLADKAAITAVVKATFADIKPGDYVGTGAVPQADGTQRAVELRIFPKPQEDGGHFYEGWFGAPKGTMTNGFVQPVTVTATAAGGQDQSIVVKYPQGEKRIIIPADANVVRNLVGSMDDLKPGAVFRVAAAAKQPDGTYLAKAIAVGRDGARPF